MSSYKKKIEVIEQVIIICSRIKDVGKGIFSEEDLNILKEVLIDLEELKSLENVGTTYYNE